MGDSPCNYSVSIRIDRVMLVSLWAETINPVISRDLIAVQGNTSVCQVNPVSRKNGEGRAERLRTWGLRFNQEGARGREGVGGAGGAAQSVRGTINPTL